MSSVSVRELQRDASAVVARAAAGEIVVITDRGLSVAQLSLLSESPYEQTQAAGLIRPASRSIRDLSEPEAGDPVAPVLEEMRTGERH